MVLETLKYTVTVYTFVSGSILLGTYLQWQMAITYNVFDVVLKWLNCTMNAFYNSVVFCGCGGLVMLKFYNICAIGSKNGIEMIELSLAMYIYFVQL